MFKTIMIVFFAEVITAVGQVLFKMSTNSVQSGHDLRKMDDHINFLKAVLSKSSLWIGMAAMAIGLVIWVIALSGAELSIVFSLGSMQYILILVLAHFMLGEKIDRMKVAGTALVILGITLISLS
jgi:drug/metabolite transporter (DMT)-like permease